MKERIRQLRKALGLNQTDFGNRIGVKQTTIAGYETGAKNPMDAVVTSICREFNVNEAWLRTGEGGNDNMFIKASPYEKAYNRFGYIMENSSPSKKAALTMLLEVLYEVPDDKWEMIMKQFEEIRREG